MMKRYWKVFAVVGTLLAIPSIAYAGVKLSADGCDCPLCHGGKG